MGKPQGWMCVRDPAPAPELVQQIWRVGDGHSLHDAINVKCAAKCGFFASGDSQYCSKCKARSEQEWASWHGALSKKRGVRA